MTSKVRAEVYRVTQQTQNPRDGASHMGDTAEGGGEVGTEGARG
ncbi:hypothetical protein [Achromobacter xylosoxidans]|nr:hypothetical protein [Achromobacter xylosoxidans]